MFETILVPVDLSEQNARSVALAGELARVGGGVVHVIETIRGLDMEEERAFYARLEKSAIRQLETLGSSLVGEASRFEADVLYGSRAAAILTQAERISADLVVMRSHRVDGSALRDGWGDPQLSNWHSCELSGIARQVRR